jgi:hypothetical protein
MSIISAGGAVVGAGGAAGYQIERSLRFDSSASASLSRTPASAGNRKTWTWSGWVKRSALNGTRPLFGVVAGSCGDLVTRLQFDTSNRLIFQDFTACSTPLYFDLITTQVFRDVSAWFHVVAVVDTTQATSTNRVKLYINGSQVTALGTAVYPLTVGHDTAWNSTLGHYIGREGDPNYFNGYLTEINFIDSPILEGETTSGSTTVTLTTGTTTNISIGFNVGGTNIPDGATVSSITNSTQFVISSAATGTGSSISFGVAPPISAFGEFNSDTGVWQPIEYTGTYGTNGFYLNFSDNASTTTLGDDLSGNGNDWSTSGFSVTAGKDNDSLVDTPTNYGEDTGVGGEVRGNYATWNPLASPTSAPTNGNLEVVNSSGTKKVTIAFPLSGKWYWEQLAGSNSIIGICNADAPTSTSVFYLNSRTAAYYNNGTLYRTPEGDTGSWGATYTSGNIVAGAIDFDAFPPTLKFYKNGVQQGSTLNLTTGIQYTIATGIGGVGVETLNCGQRPFAYTAPSGFKALCTQNLPTPTIEDGGEYFNTILYTGTGSSNALTGVGFQPDFVWIKGRSGATDHGLYNAVRGVQKQLESNNNGAETTESTGLTAFGADGFTVGALAQLNTSSATYVAWNWKADGAGSSNTDGSITSTVSANTTSGFSVGTFTSQASGTGTFGHGLGVAPSLVICKIYNITDSYYTYHISTSANGYLFLNTTAAYTASSNPWNNTAPTSTVVTLGAGFAGSYSTWFVAFAAIPGYSAFGSYTGNGSADGPFVYTGFRPRFVLVKASSAATDWYIYDTSRDTYNVATLELNPNLAAAEQNGTYGSMDINSNGFKLRFATGEVNASGATYIYYAVAENPFKYSLAR